MSVEVNDGNGAEPIELGTGFDNEQIETLAYSMLRAVASAREERLAALEKRLEAYAIDNETEATQ